ncbi:MAG: cytochrome c biogenesis protein CcsA [Sphingomonadales bacterium]|nr:cytochrome c biogenesis protein CcsA [Sphingomonadales bacterium]PIX65972.1 MAG: heme ABC transporter permease [Sphingomonadales bacterium CG_4_10_14_3_um_filter_58_15]NCO48776.1 cytochrome c biogenesis protein CcsA [Sphingomonadales bacterium]NCO99889.1 cytochrome c biogenesis protein CcsA [Sphingomonadales bacterium]NCP27377.1 cytochrome c biogenesis protein CcsA [Sphingomonadales bacterium]
MHAFANPTRFLTLAKPLTLWFLVAGLVLVIFGSIYGLLYAPADRLMGDSVRILYIHVPTVWLAMGGWTAIAIASIMQIVWRHPLAAVAARAVAVPGAVFTALGLITGSIWARPTWGAWWVWDGRVTSVLVLFFLYLAYIALANASGDKGGVSRVTAIFGIVGAINIPIINRSVVWWNSLHQPASITVSGSSIDSAFLWPLMVNVIGFSLLFGAIVLMRMRSILAETKVEARLKRMAAE